MSMSLTSSAVRGSSSFGVISLISRLSARYGAYRRTRSALNELDARMLNDIGVIPGDIDKIARRCSERF